MSKNKLSKRFSKLADAIAPDEQYSNLSVMKLNRLRLALGAGFLLLLMVLLVFRMGYWQIVKSDDLKTMAASMQKIDTEIDALRGSIYDSNGNVLAKSVTKYKLFGYTQDIYKSKEVSEASREESVKLLSEIAGISPCR